MSQQQPLISHLLELRTKLLRAIASVLIVFIALVYWANDIYHYMAIPLMQSLPDTGSMIATDVAAPFFAPFKLTLVLSFFIAVPMCCIRSGPLLRLDCINMKNVW